LAEKAGFCTGDAITSLHGQPLLSIADVQWVLHYSSGSGDTLKAELLRGTESMEITLTLPRDWRRLDDISWRASTWGLRRMTTGGLVLEPASKEDRQAANVADGSMALRVKHVGQYGAHAAGKNAGFRQGDIIVSINGKSEFLREADWMFHSLNELRPGDRAKVSVMRDGKKVELNLPMQD
jgi:S1-C subfamily serine protease